MVESWHQQCWVCSCDWLDSASANCRWERHWLGVCCNQWKGVHLTPSLSGQHLAADRSFVVSDCFYIEEKAKILCCWDKKCLFYIWLIMKYPIMRMRGAYKCNLFCSVIVGYLRDDLQNQILKNSPRVGNGKFHSPMKRWCYWYWGLSSLEGVKNSLSWRHRCLHFFN